MSVTAVVILNARLGILISLVVAAGFDFCRRIIPNETVAAVAGGGLLIRLLSSAADPVWMSLAGAAVVFVGLALLSGAGLLGGGDVKMIAGVTLGEPGREILPLLLDIALAGGILAAVYFAAGRSLTKTPVDAGGKPRTEHPVAFALHRLASAGPARIGGWTTLPYGLAILAGTVWHGIDGVRECLFAGLCSS